MVPGEILIAGDPASLDLWPDTPLYAWDYEALLGHASTALARRREGYPKLVERGSMDKAQADEDIAAWELIEAEWRWIVHGSGELPPASSLDQRLAAIDLATGAIAWRAPMDRPLIGGVLATAGKLVFVGESGGRFSAFDSVAGARLWSEAVSAGVNAPPVTFAVDGRQYVTVAIGGNALFGFETGDELVTYALPAAP